MLSLLLLASLSVAASGDSVGIVQGVVVMRSDGSPGLFANVIVVGTRLGTQADESGRFVIRRVPLGRQVIRTILPRAAARTDTVEVLPSEPAVLRIVMEGEPWEPSPQPIRIGSRTSAVESDFVATIRPVKQFRVGDKARFEVRISNQGSGPAFLVRTNEYSTRGGSPSAWIAIVGPPGGWPGWDQSFKGSSVGTEAADFVEIPPGSEFNPFENKSPYGSANGTFDKPGRYTATFRYITTNTWPGSWQRRCRSGPCPDLRKLLEQTPLLDLIALTTFEVVP